MSVASPLPLRFPTQASSPSCSCCQAPAFLAPCPHTSSSYSAPEPPRLCSLGTSHAGTPLSPEVSTGTKPTQVFPEDETRKCAFFGFPSLCFLDSANLCIPLPSDFTNTKTLTSCLLRVGQHPVRLAHFQRKGNRLKTVRKVKKAVMVSAPSSGLHQTQHR